MWKKELSSKTGERKRTKTERKCRTLYAATAGGVVMRGSCGVSSVQWRRCCLTPLGRSRVSCEARRRDKIATNSSLDVVAISSTFQDDVTKTFPTPPCGQRQGSQGRIQNIPIEPFESGAIAPSQDERGITSPIEGVWGLCPLVRSRKKAPAYQSGGKAS